MLPDSANSRPISGLILASGMAHRFGAGNKLLVPVGGVPVVRRVAEAFLAARLDPVLVVVGHEADAVRDALAGLPITFVDNPEYSQGQSRALVRGVVALPESTPAAVIGVADQPFLTADVITEIVEAYETGERPIVVPWYGNRPGNPVLYDRSLFAELLAVTGDKGGREVRDRDPGRVLRLDLSRMLNAGIDIDREEDWERVASS